MDLKVDSAFIKAERQKRGWSQEHLAAAAGLGLRTIQRMESAGTGSNESAKCLAAVFEVDLARLFLEKRTAPPVRMRIWAAAAASCATLATSLFLISSANATDVAMAVVVGSEVTGESRMNLIVASGRQAEIKLEKDLWLLLTPTLQSDGNILVAAELYGWDGSDFKLASKPRLLVRPGAETRLQLRLGNGRSTQISITPKET